METAGSGAQAWLPLSTFSDVIYIPVYTENREAWKTWYVYPNIHAS